MEFRSSLSFTLHVFSRTRRMNESGLAPRNHFGAMVRRIMTRNAESLLREALQLTPAERAKLAAELLSSLEDWRGALDDVRRDVLSR